MPDVQRVIDTISRSTQASLLVASMSGDVIAQTAHDPAADPLTADAVLRRRLSEELLQAISSAAVALRALTPTTIGTPSGQVRFAQLLMLEGTRCGYLVGTCPQGDLETTLQTVSSLTRELTLALVVQRKEAGTERAGERRALEDLLSDDAGRRGAGAALLVERRWFVAGPSTVLVAEIRSPAGSSDEARVATSLATESLRDTCAPREAVTLPRQSHGVLVVAGDAPQRLRHAADTLHEHLMLEARGIDLGADDCGVGIGRTVPDLGMLHESYACARAALRTKEIERQGGVVVFDEIGPYRLLTQLSDEQLDEVLDAGVARLSEHDRAHQSTLTLTLEAYLDLAGDARATSEALHLHRASLYHRLRRIEQIAELDLASGSRRLEVHLALKAARLRGVLKEPPVVASIGSAPRGRHSAPRPS